MLAFLGELLWWPLFLSSRANVTAPWTIAVHAFAVVSLAALVWYARSKKTRAKVFAAAPPAASRSLGLHLRIGRFPVYVDWVFVVMALVCSMNLSGRPSRAPAFILLVTLAVLAHELGHAAAAARSGCQGIQISLHAFGGATTYLGSGRRSEHVNVALAGPAVGLFLGCIVWSIGRLFPSFVAESFLYRDLLFVTVGWSLLNLLPIHPLDGGVLLSGAISSETASRWLSVAVAAIAAAITMRTRHHGLVLFFVILAIFNVLAVPAVVETIERLKTRYG